MLIKLNGQEFTGIINFKKKKVIYRIFATLFCNFLKGILLVPSPKSVVESKMSKHY